jgi:hypothetical protein
MSFAFGVVVVVVVGVDVVAGLLQVLMVLMATIFELGYIWIKSKILHYVCRWLLLLSSSSSWLSCNAPQLACLLPCLLRMYVSHHTPQCCQFDHTHDMKKMNVTLNYKPSFCGVWDGW